MACSDLANHMNPSPWGTIMDWWMASSGRAPIGPIRTEDLLLRIEAGMVPRDALVCEVGQTTWQRIADIPPFSLMFDGQEGEADADGFYMAFDADPHERTTVKCLVSAPSEPPSQESLMTYGEADEETTDVDAAPDWAAEQLKKAR